MKIVNLFKNYYKKNSAISTLLKIYSFIIDIMLVRIKILFLSVTPIKSKNQSHDLTEQLIVTINLQYLL